MAKSLTCASRLLGGCCQVAIATVGSLGEDRLTIILHNHLARLGKAKITAIAAGNEEGAVIVLVAAFVLSATNCEALMRCY